MPSQASARSESVPINIDQPSIPGTVGEVQDLTDEYEAIVRFQYLIFGLSTLFMGLMVTYGTLLLRGMMLLLRWAMAVSIYMFPRRKIVSW